LLHAERWRKAQRMDLGSHHAVIELHLMDGRDAEAARALKAGLEILTLPRGKAFLLVYAAGSYLDAGQFERSEELLRQAIALAGDDATEPWYPSTQHALGLAHLKQGRPEEAIPFIEEAARLQPRRTLVQEHLRQARQ